MADRDRHIVIPRATIEKAIQIDILENTVGKTTWNPKKYSGRQGKRKAEMKNRTNRKQEIK